MEICLNEGQKAAEEGYRCCIASAKHFGSVSCQIPSVEISVRSIGLNTSLFLSQSRVRLNWI